LSFQERGAARMPPRGRPNGEAQCLCDIGPIALTRSSSRARCGWRDKESEYFVGIRPNCVKEN